MWPVTPGFLTALSQPHGIAVTVEAWRDGSRYGAVPIGGGAVQVTSRNRIRRTLTVTISEDYWDEVVPGGLLDPYGNELRVWWSLVGVDGETETVPVFRGRIEGGDRTRRAGQFGLKCLDRFAQINDEKFESPRMAPAQAPVTSAIRDLIAEVWPDASVVAEGVTDALVPANLTWDRDRGQAVDDLAESIAAEVYADPDGNFHIRPVPRIIGTTGVWSLVDGTSGTVVNDVQAKTRTGVPNSIVVLVERAGETPTRVTVQDTSASSPTQYGGRFGRIPTFLQSPLITTEAQAYAAGLAKLARYVGLDRQRTITAVPNPALEGGDVVTVTVDGESEVHVADTIDFGLSADDAMTIATRSARDSGDLDGQ